MRQRSVIFNANAVTPMTHQPEHGSVSRSIGLLRRLAILPPQIEFFPSDPKNCMGECDWDRLRLDVAQAVPKYLAEWRGYEVVVLDPLVPEHGSVELPSQRLEDFAGALATFAEQRSSEPPSGELAETVRLVGKQTWVDGLVVVRGSVTALTWVEGWSAFPLALSGYGLLAALPVEMARIGSKFEADIFEAGTGRLVWASVYSSSGNPLAGPESRNDLVTQLLDPIEPALPTVMTRQINAME